MRLVDVWSEAESLQAAQILWRLLEERTTEVNISHRSMPSWQEHLEFICRRTYAHWYLIVPEVWPVGAVYLTHQREIGIGILRAHQRKGYAREALDELMRRHPGRFLANINPANEASIALFRRLGFGGPIQITLERPA